MEVNYLQAAALAKTSNRLTRLDLLAAGSAGVGARCSGILPAGSTAASV